MHLILTGLGGLILERAGVQFNFDRAGMIDFRPGRVHLFIFLIVLGTGYPRIFGRVVGH